MGLINIIFPTKATVAASRMGDAGGGTIFCQRGYFDTFKKLQGTNFQLRDSKSKAGNVLMHSKVGSEGVSLIVNSLLCYVDDFGGASGHTRGRRGFRRGDPRSRWEEGSESDCMGVCGVAQFYTQRMGEHTRKCVQSGHNCEYCSTLHYFSLPDSDADGMVY